MLENNISLELIGFTVLINVFPNLYCQLIFPENASKAKIKPFLVAKKTTPSFSTSIDGAISKPYPQFIAHSKSKLLAFEETAKTVS